MTTGMPITAVHDISVSDICDVEAFDIVMFSASLFDAFIMFGKCAAAVITQRPANAVEVEIKASPSFAFTLAAMAVMIPANTIIAPIINNGDVKIFFTKMFITNM